MKITIKDQTPLCSEYKVIVVGSVGIEKVNFELDETWEKLQVFACFKNSSSKEEYSQFLSNSNEAYIPWEVLTVPGTLFIGVLGMDGERIIKPTIWKEVAKIREGTSTDGIASEEHSATALEQVVELAQSVRDDADAGKFDGVGIEQIEINTLGELVITYTDGTIDNLGVVATGGGSITPQIRINSETNEWEISTDGGKTFVSTGVKATGKNGVSATHSWNGTVLTITSASGTSSADLKGDQGNSGIYIGSGEMPEEYVFQIDPEGEPYILTEEDKQEIADIVLEELPDLPSGSGGEWEKVVDVTTTEEVNSIYVNTDINGNPLNLDINDEICIFFIAAPTATNNANQATSFNFNSTNIGTAFGYASRVIYTSQYHTLRYIKTTPSFPSGWMTYSVGFHYSQNNNIESGWADNGSREMFKYIGKNINSIMYTNHDKGVLGVGSRMVAYVRKGN